MSEPTEVQVNRQLELSMEARQAKIMLADRINSSQDNVGYVVIELTSMGGSTGVQLLSTGPAIPAGLRLGNTAARACEDNAKIIRPK